MIISKGSIQREAVHRGGMEPAYILHTRPYRDTSLIMELFTKNQGRISVLARGARSHRRRGQQGFRLFSPLLVSLRGRGELKTVAQVEHLETALKMAGDALLVGLYVNELLYHLLGRHEEMPSVFAEYHQLLHVVAEGGEIESYLRKFEISLLAHLGYGLTFDCDLVSGKPVQPGLSYTFLPDSGFVEVGVTAGGVVSYAGDQLICLARGELQSRETLAVAKQILRQAISFRLGGKQLKSRALFGARQTANLATVESESIR